MESERIRSIQDDEKLVLSSIFGDDVSFASSPWKVWQPIHATFHLEPVQTDTSNGMAAIFVSLDMHILCSDRYPYELPKITFGNVKGISAAQVEELSRSLAKMAYDSSGNAMILDLCLAVRDFLFERNSPPKGSFHDGMLQQKAAEEFEFQRKRLSSEAREYEEIKEEKERREREVLWQKEEMEMRKKNADEDFGEADCRRIGEYRIRVVAAKSELRKEPHSLCREFTATLQGEHVLASEWKFVYSQGRKSAAKAECDFSPFFVALEQLEVELKNVMDLDEVDSTLVPLAFCVVTTTSRCSSNMNVTVHVAQKISAEDENLGATSISNAFVGDEGRLRGFAVDSVCALRWLHDQGITHGNVHPNSFWRTKDGRFRLSDYATMRGLLLLADCFRECCSGVTSTRLPKDKLSKRNDLFSLGTILDGFGAAKNSPENSRGPEEMSLLIDFCKRCQSAKSADEVLDHPFLLQDVYPTSSDSSRTIPLSLHSRLLKEFLVIKWLGKGGFGEVLLARNKLDGNDYAVKRIRLDAESERLNRRVMREAKLFSKLNHPHVVRYFAAWTEETNGVSSTPSSRIPSMPQDSSPSSMPQESMLPSRLRNLEKAFASDAANAAHELSEWTTSCRGQELDDSSSSDYEDDLPVHPRTLFSPQDKNSSFDILFEGSTHDQFDAEEKSLANNKTDSEKTPSVPQSSRILFIQMEYCGKGTLRWMIDCKALVESPKTAWRIFTEILYGLQYIHKEGMIHRDIKPMNILLDSRERVKIGDFGLATRELIFSRRDGVGEGDAGSSQTKDIGTELYMAPELLAGAHSIQPYSNKIDVYSAGIVLFEMFYRPLTPGMERISTIRTVRSTGRVPADFGGGSGLAQSSRARLLIERMLSSDSKDRPSVDRILEEDSVPITDVEDDLFQKHFSRLMNKRSGRLFQWTLQTLFAGTASSAASFCYDHSICRERFSVHREFVLSNCRRSLESLLRMHAFLPLTAPTLRANAPEDKKGTRTRPAVFIDQAGCPVSLSMDLRTNFVRVCARSAVNRLKRYSIDKVFGYHDASGSGGVHPTERWECSVDCLGPESSAPALSASLLSLISDIHRQLVTSSAKTLLRIGHMALVRACLRHLGVSIDLHESLLQTMSALSNGAKRVEKSKELAGVLSFLPSSSSPSSLKTELRTLLRSRDESSRESAKAAISELQTLHDALRACEDAVGESGMELCFDTSLVQRPSTFSDGIVFQLEVEVASKERSRKWVPLLVGGRCDSLLAAERSPHDVLLHFPLCLFGFSLSLDLLTTLVLKTNPELRGGARVLLCSIGGPRLVEKLHLAASLRSRSIPADLLHEPLGSPDQLTEYCEATGVSVVVVVMSAEEALIQRLSKGEKLRIPLTEVPACLVAMSPSLSLEPPSLAPSFSQSALSQSSLHDSANISNQRSASSVSMANVNIVYSTVEKMAYNTRKRVEVQLHNALSDVLTNFSPKILIHVLVVDTPLDLVNSIASQMCDEYDESRIRNLFDGLSRQHGRAKESLEAVYRNLLPLAVSPTPRSPILLFRHSDAAFRFIF